MTSTKPRRASTREYFSTFHWGNGNLSFRLFTGDIFKLGVDAIVNSEQSDFVLAPSGSSISAQISKRGGKSVQEELQKLTGGKELPPGTVLETSLGNLGHIYHAAIHEPSLFQVSASNEQDILGNIENCLREILRLAVEDPQIQSVAIPLLGAGIFGLPPAFSGATVARTVARFALAVRPSKPLEVTLVVRPDRTGQQGLAAAIQVLLDEGALPPPWTAIQLGIPLLDPLEQEISRAHDPQWRAVLLCRYAEVFTHYAHAVLATRVPDRCQERLGCFYRPVSFGTIAAWLQELAKNTLSAGAPPVLWALANHCLERDSLLRQLVEARNHLVHGRSAPPTEVIEALLREFIDATRWKAQASPLPTAGLAPWVLTLPSSDKRTMGMAILERLKNSPSLRLCYLDPCSGLAYQLSPQETLKYIEPS